MSSPTETPTDPVPIPEDPIPPPDLTRYQERAANVPKPADYIEPTVLSRIRQAIRSDTARNVYYNDTSQFQGHAVNSAYPYPMFAFRVDNGSGYDDLAFANRDAVNRLRGIKLAKGYVVYIPGAESAILSRFKNLFGAHPPAWLAAMIDMESGSQFAGPGNHSWGANWLAQELADYLGARERVAPYANYWDYIANWPQMSGWLVARRCTAAYGTSLPWSSYEWQYYGGIDYGHLSGYPTWNACFGSFVDFNVVRGQSIDDVLMHYGMHPNPERWLEMTSLSKVRQKWRNDIHAAEHRILLAVDKSIQTAVPNAFMSYDKGGVHGRWNPKTYTGWIHRKGYGVTNRLDSHRDQITAIKTNMAEIHGELRAIHKAITALQHPHKVEEPDPTP